MSQSAYKVGAFSRLKADARGGDWCSARGAVLVCQRDSRRFLMIRLSRYSYVVSALLARQYFCFEADGGLEPMGCVELKTVLKHYAEALLS